MDKFLEKLNDELSHATEISAGEVIVFCCQEVVQSFEFIPTVKTSHLEEAIKWMKNYIQSGQKSAELRSLLKTVTSMVPTVDDPPDLNINELSAGLTFIFALDTIVECAPNKVLQVVSTARGVIHSVEYKKQFPNDPNRLMPIEVFLRGKQVSNSIALKRFEEAVFQLCSKRS